MELKIEYVKTEDLKPYANNAKIHTAEQVEQIKKSILGFGMNDPIAVWKDNEIIEGHGRLIACLELGIEEVPIIRLDQLTDEQRRAYMLVHNQLTMNTGFDNAVLDIELDNIAEIDMEQYGFDDVYEIDDSEPQTITEDEPPQMAKELTRSGDIWELGNHRLICGDSTDTDIIGRLMNGNIADITITSPPYNAGEQGIYGKNTSKYQNYSDDFSADEYRSFLNSFLRTALHYSQYVFCNIQSLAGNKIALIDFLYDNKDIYADTMIWDKQHTQPANAYNVMNSTYEYIHVFSEKANRAIGTKPFRGTIDNVLRMNGQHGNEYAQVHSATFPVEFAAYFVDNFAENSVLDVFGGTGTTMIACEQLGKKCYMSELDSKYCDIIVQRYIDFVGTSEDVYLTRDNERIEYDNVKEV